MTASLTTTSHLQSDPGNPSHPHSQTLKTVISAFHGVKMTNFDYLPRGKVAASSPDSVHPQRFNYSQFPDGIPRPLSPNEMPSKYKPAERRVRVMIIALPIAIVTSYVLWNRFVKGEERKVFIRQSPPGGPATPSPSAHVDSVNVGPTTAV